jgi:hypothetical protein
MPSIRTIANTQREAVHSRAPLDIRIQMRHAASNDWVLTRVAATMTADSPSGSRTAKFEIMFTQVEACWWTKVA